MTSVSVTLFTRFFLCATLLGAVAGCGSNNSTAESKTGSIAAKLTWSSSDGKAPAKTLYLTPAGVTNVRITVSGAGISPAIFKNFTTTAGSAGSGTIDGIPVGTERTITAVGMDSDGFVRYQGAVSGITINLGTANPPVEITMTAPVTTATPAGGASSYPLSVRLATGTASEPATIYYTTNGNEPTTSSTHGTSPFDIQILGPATLKFFAIDSGFAREATKTETYN